MNSNIFQQTDKILIHHFYQACSEILFDCSILVHLTTRPALFPGRIFSQQFHLSCKLNPPQKNILLKVKALQK